jgi:hypothetical protein
MEVDSRLKGYIPPKTQALIGVNVDKIRQSDFYKRHAAQLSFPQLNEFSQQLGMDPRRDLSSFLVAWNGVDTLAMSRGTFDSAQLAKRLQSAHMTSESYDKATLYGDGRNDLALLPKGIAIGGSALLLKKTLDQDATGGGGIPEDLQLQLARINSGAQAWSVTSGVISLDKLAMRGDTAINLSNISDYISATAVGLTLGSGLALDAHVTCISEEGSQRVNDALRGVIGLARLSTPDSQLDQLKLWDSIHVTKQGKEVHITSELTPELADKLLTIIPSLERRF